MTEDSLLALKKYYTLITQHGEALMQAIAGGSRCTAMLQLHIDDLIFGTTREMVLENLKSLALQHQELIKSLESANSQSTILTNESQSPSLVINSASILSDSSMPTIDTPIVICGKTSKKSSVKKPTKKNLSSSKAQTSVINPQVIEETITQLENTLTLDNQTNSFGILEQSVGVLNPTGYDSTGSISTAFNSTASNPITSDSIASNPTTSDPTGSNPTGSNLTGSNLTASDPTGSNPTGSNTTGSNLTASDPTDSNPTTLNPTNSTSSKKSYRKKSDDSSLKKNDTSTPKKPRAVRKKQLNETPTISSISSIESESVESENII